MPTMHICLICHTEGGANALDIGVSSMLRIRESVEQRTGKPCPLTWALGTFHATGQPPIFHQYRDRFLALSARGDEIGLHPHGVAQNGRWDVDPFIAEDTRQLVAAGFARPKTFVAGVWAFYPSTLAILEAEGYQVDASVVAGPTRQRQVDENGIVLHDYPPSEALADAGPFAVPYRLSRDSVVRRGDSSVIEVPVSGHLMDFAPSTENVVLERYRLVRERLATTGVEVLEIFWHSHELLQSYHSWYEEPRIRKAFAAFLGQAASEADVRISSVYDAAMAWSVHAEGKGEAHDEHKWKKMHTDRRDEGHGTDHPECSPASRDFATGPLSPALPHRLPRGALRPL
jgi:hypothetical protein